MSSKHRILCTLMLLVVMASQAFGGAHAATHVGADPGGCALCATFGNSAAALPPAGLPPLPVLTVLPAVECLPLAKSKPAVLCNHQRGPPPPRIV